MKEKQKATFLMYLSWAKYIYSLPEDLAAQLAKAICAVEIGEESPQISDTAVRIFFESVVLPELVKNDQKYEEIRQKRSEYGKMKGKNQETDESISQHMLAYADTSKHKSAYASYSESESESESPSESGSVSGSVSGKDNTNTDVSKDTSCRPLADDRVPYSEIRELFNSTCTSLPHILSLSESRKRVLRPLYKRIGMDGIRELFQKAEASDFLSGRSGDWQASFDWLIKAGNSQKVLEGNYDRQKHQPQSRLAAADSILDAIARGEA